MFDSVAARGNKIRTYRRGSPRQPGWEQVQVPGLLRTGCTGAEVGRTVPAAEPVGVVVPGHTAEEGAVHTAAAVVGMVVADGGRRAGEHIRTVEQEPVPVVREQGRELRRNLFTICGEIQSARNSMCVCGQRSQSAVSASADSQGNTKLTCCRTRTLG